MQLTEKKKEAFSVIEINNLVKKYGDHVAVDDLSLTVEPGKIYGFLGPNGAGKSTTMNIITGYLGATSGEVKINGHDIFKEPEEAKKCIGYLPEIPPLYVDMTVREYLDFVAELKKPGRDPRTMAKVFSFAEGISKIEDLQVGMVIPGIVTNITGFGAFVDVGVKQDGLVHISEIADRYVTDPAAELVLNQQVMVKVVQVEPGRKRIGLSIRQAQSKD